MSKRMMQMLVAVALVLAALGFVNLKQIQGAMAMGKSFQQPPEAVTTTIAQMQRWPESVSAIGSVAPVQGVTLSGDQPGVVDKIEFTSGAHVQEGDVLVTLDTRQERAQLASAQAQRDLAKNALDRAKPLLEQKLIAQAEFDQTESQFKQADANVSEIKATIDRKTIRAPFAGRCGIRQVNIGQYVKSGDPIVPLMSEDPVYVNFSVPQQQVASLRVGATAYAAADTGSAETAEGRISAINPVVDETTRNVLVQATMRNPRTVLRAGAYVRVRVLLGARDPVVAVPASAINYAPYGNSIFIVEKMKGPKGESYLGVRQQFVRLGASQGDQVAVLDGLKPGEQVVSSGVFKLRPNQSVQVNNKVTPSNSLAPKPEDS